MKRIWCIALCFAILISGILVADSAGKKAKSANYSVSNPARNSEGITTWDCVYFGNYFQSTYTPVNIPENLDEYDTWDPSEYGNDDADWGYKNTDAIYTDDDGTKFVWRAWNETSGDETEEKEAYYKYEPIKWRVMAVNGNDAFLIADRALDTTYYWNKSDNDYTWESQYLRRWLNKVFLSIAFSDDEQCAIIPTNVQTLDNPTYGTSGGNPTIDKVYIPSIEEMTNTAYGFSAVMDEKDNARIWWNTAYSNGTDTDDVDSEYYFNANPWLRSKGYSDNYYTYFNGDIGTVSDCGMPISNGSVRSVCPVIHLDLSSSSWTYAGRVSSNGTISSGKPDEDLSGEKIEDLLTLSGSVLTSNDSSHDTVKEGSYQYDGYLQTMYTDTIKSEYPYYKVTFRSDEKLTSDTKVFVFQPFNLEWGGWEENIITVGDAVYDPLTDEYTAYIKVQDICDSLSTGTLQGINISFYNKEPAITLTGFYQSSGNGTLVQPQATIKPTENPASVSTLAPTPRSTSHPSGSAKISSKPTMKKLPTIKKPARVKIKKLKKAGKGCAKVTWGKVKCSDGYQIQYSRTRKFRKKKTETSYSKSTYIFGKSKKTYYVRVRAVNVGWKTQISYGYKYGQWSKVKKIRLK